MRIFKVGRHCTYSLEFFKVKIYDWEIPKSEVVFCFLVLKKRKDNDEIPYTPE